ncbi:CU044_5270 family protein [Streptomyces sp. NPDC004856]|uniref:CU044_5270 family protein n=1 Tax=Streptomyces sp. NPDC004856 TaxID=3154556 RepID=UPI0033A51F28
MNGNPRRSGRRAPGQDGRDGQSPEEYRELAGLLPAPARPELGQDRHRVLREHMMEHITREATRSAEPDDRATPSLTPLPPPERRFRRLAAPLALVVVVTAGAVVVDQVRDGAGGAGTQQVTVAERREAERLLNRIAGAAGRRPADTVRDDQYIYTRSQGDSSVLGGPDRLVRDREGDIVGAAPYEGPVVSEQWDPVDGKRDGLRRYEALDARDWPEEARTQDMAMSGVPYLTFRELRALPTDPDALLKKLYRDTKGVQSDRTEAVVEYIRVILGQATLLPDLGAALYRATARLPGVRVVRNVEDAAGRKGIGLAFAGSRDHVTWVFDRSSLAYLGTTRTALLEVGVADQKGRAPKGS